MVASGRRLFFDNCFFFYCEEEVIISAVDEDTSFPITVGIGDILTGTLIILSFGGFFA